MKGNAAFTSTESRLPATVTLSKQLLLQQQTPQGGWHESLALSPAAADRANAGNLAEHSQVAIVCGEGLPRLSGSETLVHVVCEKTISPQIVVKQIPFASQQSSFACDL